VNRTRLLAVPVALACALLPACSSEDSSSDAASPDSASSDSASSDSASSDSGSEFIPGTLDEDILARFSSCADIEPYVADYIDGLQAGAVSEAGENGAYCQWESPATDLDAIRTVGVILEPGTGTVYSAEQMGGSGLTVISDADIESEGRNGREAEYCRDSHNSVHDLLPSVRTSTLEVRAGRGSGRYEYNPRHRIRFRPRAGEDEIYLNAFAKVRECRCGRSPVVRRQETTITRHEQSGPLHDT